MCQFNVPLTLHYCTFTDISKLIYNAGSIDDRVNIETFLTTNTLYPIKTTNLTRSYTTCGNILLIQCAVSSCVCGTLVLNVTARQRYTCLLGSHQQLTKRLSCTLFWSHTHELRVEAFLLIFVVWKLKIIVVCFTINRRTELENINVQEKLLDLYI